MKIAHSLFKESEPLNKDIIKESEVKLESISSEIFLIEKEKNKNIYKEEKEDEQKPIQSKISKIEIEPIKKTLKKSLLNPNFLTNLILILFI